MPALSDIHRISRIISPREAKLRDSSTHEGWQSIPAICSTQETHCCSPMDRITAYLEENPIRSATEMRCL